MSKETRTIIVNELCEIISKNNLQNNEAGLIAVLSQFLFSVGSSIEKVEMESSYDVLMRYAENPTLGNVLMAQAMHMKETWIDQGRQKDESESKSRII